MVVQPEVPPSLIRKYVAMSLLFDRSSPKLVETLGRRFETYDVENA